MKLKMVKRLTSKRSENNRIRREGNIPAVLYSAGSANENISVDGVEFAEVVRNMIPGRLSTIKFKLVEGGKEVAAIIKEIQYHPTTYQVLHLDFERLTPGVSVTLNIPLEFSGVAECTGIKLGGFLREVIRQVKVCCTPELIPTVFTIDVRNLSMGQSERVSNIQMPKGVKPLTPLQEVAVVIERR